MTELADILTERLQALWGPAVEVSAVRPMPGGASRESWDIEVRRPGQSQGHLVLLRDAGVRAWRPARSIEIEAAAMIAARSAGVPVADLYDHGEGALGRAYLLMERLEGEDRKSTRLNSSHPSISYAVFCLKKKKKKYKVYTM